MPATIIQEFDVWRVGYGGATVQIYKAGTTELAAVFYDPAATVPGMNPVTLLTFMIADTNFGKFPRSLYVSHPYDIRISDTGENTGVLNTPINDLEGMDASGMVAKPTGGTAVQKLSDLFGLDVWALHFGSFTDDPQANTSIIAAAIGEASARGGAKVLLPAGTIPFLKLDIPDNVMLCGVGKAATVLQSLSGEPVITFSGNFCGLADLTVDGVQRIPLSIGLRGVMRIGVHLSGVLVKRFARNAEFRGGSWFHWNDVDVMDGNDGVILMGDDNSGGNIAGGPLENFSWVGGRLEQHSDAAFQAIYEDFPIRHILLDKLNIQDNTESAVELVGAQFVNINRCDFSGNTRWLVVADDDLSTVNARRDNTVHVVTLSGCDIDGGGAVFGGECETILFQRCKITNTEINLLDPTNSITVLDCVERQVSLNGVTQAWTRLVTAHDGIVIGRTTSSATITAWRQRLGYGEIGLFEATILGVTKNLVQTFLQKRRGMYRRLGLTLPYTGQTQNFTLGNRISGSISGANGVIQAQTDSGATGTLTLVDVEGSFTDDEPLIEDGGDGNGFVNLPITDPAVTAATADVGIQGTIGDGGTATFAASGEHVVLTIAGIDGQTTDWTVKVEGVISRA